MNNEQFRRLILENASKDKSTAKGSKGAPQFQQSFGSRSRASIPMTPRSVTGASAPNIVGQRAAENARQATSKHKGSVPKGTRYAEGYRDRALDRRAAEEKEDERAARIAALEKSFKEGDIDEGTFERLRDEITGGDINATHLVKGLDRRLLARVRKGEDVFMEKGPSAPQPEGDRPQTDDDGEDLDVDLDAVLNQEVIPVQQEKKEKKGQLALAGSKRTRDAILAELKASRKAAAEAKAAQAPELGSKFRKIGHTQESQRLEMDSRGREVLVIVDEHGNEKRKYRKIKDVPTSELLKPEKGAKPLGMAVPEGFEAKVPVSEDDDDDIFTGVGAEYNPLAQATDDSDSDESDEGEVKTRPGIHEHSSDGASSQVEADALADFKEAKPQVPSKRNYFQDSPEGSSPVRRDPMHDPILLAALRKPRRKSRSPSLPSDPEEAARLKRRAAMLATDDRDMEDMDLGFGGSRFEDAEDMEDRLIKLSKWKGGAVEDDEDDDGHHGRGTKEKRRRRKRKGDKNSAEDVMRVIEGRKKRSE